MAEVGSPHPRAPLPKGEGRSLRGKLQISRPPDPSHTSVSHQKRKEIAMKVAASALVMFLLLATAPQSVRAAETVWLGSLDLSKMQQGWGKAQIDRSISEKPLRLAGKQFARGVGTHAERRVDRPGRRIGTVSRHGGRGRLRGQAQRHDLQNRRRRQSVVQVGRHEPGPAAQGGGHRPERRENARPDGRRGRRQHRLCPRRLGRRPLLSQRRQPRTIDAPVRRRSFSRPRRRRRRASTAPRFSASGPAPPSSSPSRPPASVP